MHQLSFLNIVQNWQIQKNVSEVCMIEISLEIVSRQVTRVIPKVTVHVCESLNALWRNSSSSKLNRRSPMGARPDIDTQNVRDCNCTCFLVVVSSLGQHWGLKYETCKAFKYGFDRVVRSQATYLSGRLFQFDFFLSIPHHP